MLNAWEMENTYKTSDGKSDRRRFLVRTREANTKRNLKEIG